MHNLEEALFQEEVVAPDSVRIVKSCIHNLRNPVIDTFTYSYLSDYSEYPLFM
jgi:hypothetical protein